MKRASEYRQHAQECRTLAVGMDTEEQRALMLNMAEHWDRLADERLALIDKDPRARDGKLDEVRTWSDAP